MNIPSDAVTHVCALVWLELLPVRGPRVDKDEGQVLKAICH